MSQNPPQQPQQSLSTVSAAAKRCFTCDSDDHWILHNVKSRDDECRKYCTSCVLNLYPTSFCPICFNLHDPNSLNPPPHSSSSSSSSNNRTLTCLKCSSVSHITCVHPKTPKSPYLCPSCSNPSFKFFDLKKPRKFRDQPPSDGGSSGGDGGSHSNQQRQFLDERAARMFLLAAKISAISMNKAVAFVKSDAERKVREAALARKRAKEAIDHVMALSSKLVNVKQQRRDVLASGPRTSFEPLKPENNGVARNVGVSRGDNRVGNGNGTLAVVPMVQIGGTNQKNNNHNHVGGVKGNAG